MAVIQVSKIPIPEITAREALREFCYYYPQYTYKEARKLPYPHVLLMLKTAKRKMDEHYYNLTQIMAAPHTKDGSGVKELSKFYSRNFYG